MESWMSKSLDTRPRKGMWAPGSYICRCLDCEEHFVGDKRALSCAPCAYKMPDTEVIAKFRAALERIASYRSGGYCKELPSLERFEMIHIARAVLKEVDE
jgi:hypothetical protein